MLLVDEKKEHTAMNPPAYEDIIVGRATIPVPPNVPLQQFTMPNGFIRPPTNMVHVRELNGSIKDSWVIDTSLSPPISMAASSTSATPQIRPNIKLEAHNGSIKARILLMMTEPRPSRAVIDCSSHNGGVKITTLRHPSYLNKCQIRAYSKNGKIELFIPRDFCGPVHASTKNGKVKFTDAVLACVTVTTTSARGGGEYFIGDWRSVQTPYPAQQVENPLSMGQEGVAPAPTTAMPSIQDEIWAESANGDIKVKFVDEGEDAGWCRQDSKSSSKCGR